MQYAATALLSHVGPCCCPLSPSVGDVPAVWLLLLHQLYSDCKLLMCSCRDFSSPFEIHVSPLDFFSGGLSIVLNPFILL